MRRLDQIDRFYEILQDLENKLGGKRCLAECHGKMKWPRRGVYFFFEPGEKRRKCHGLRVVRVGTHALKPGSRSTLWKRLRTHRGTLTGKRPEGGNHRSSIFRRHVGSAIIRKEGIENRFPRWGINSSAPIEVRNQEYPIEKKASQYIRAMPFLWLKVNDPAGPQSQRACFERNTIILLSNYGKLGTADENDPPSIDWLGKFCKNEKISKSGLWNDKHVQKMQCDSKYLDKLEAKVRVCDE